MKIGILRYAYLTLILSVAFMLIGCEQKRHYFNKNDFKQALNICFQDKGFVVMGGFKPKNKYVVSTNYKIADSMSVKGINFYINPDTINRVKKGKLIMVKISYPDLNNIKFNLEYTPGDLYQLRKELRFLYEKDHWKLIDQNSVVADGEFK
ncbi:hypothetical protein EZ456_02210 [Pedobacter psychrodurus]|uniref:Lipoprotein n=1 Tax=Pedobacter psychrodurus TaxID=2530456 RepID=A0A4R0QAB7_9SPHI|nr:hypothetical protein [Pedobacter psychrodurus]TCD28995.1 hypothetical protein EZ456_02210 [Pedobacter psychrodurus]